MIRVFAIGLELVQSQEKAKIDEERRRQKTLDAIRRSLRPELLNRIQDIVLFHPLSEAVMLQIIDKIIDNLRSRLREREIEIELTEAAYAVLVQEGFDPRSGAREMERVIGRLLVQPLGRALLEGRFRGPTTVRVDAQDGELYVEDAQETRAAFS